MVKKNSNSDIAVIIPAYNEEKGVGLTLKELQDVLGDPYYLLVDGNSVDRTVELAKGIGAHVILQEGRGKGRAVAQALQRVNSGTRYVVFTDADYTYPAEYIPKMIEILEKNPNVAMVTGNRFDKRFIFSNAMSNIYYFGNRFLALVQFLLNGVKLRDPLTGLRVIRWEVLRNWKPKSKDFDIEAELNCYVKRNGYRLIEIPIGYRQRLGKKKLSVKHGFAIFKRILLQSLTALLESINEKVEKHLESC